MTKYFDPDLSEEILETYQGYSLQVFASGRSKLSFHRSHKDRAEYYAVKPKRFREAYRRQYDRSASSMSEHYHLIEQLLAEHPESLVYRVHRKGDSNATADNAHVIVLMEKRRIHVLLGTLHPPMATTNSGHECSAVSTWSQKALPSSMSIWPATSTTGRM